MKRFFTYSALIFFLSTINAYAQDKDVHEVLFDETDFPSAKKCQTCHPTHYKEWSVSSHAYAQISPVFNAMNTKITELTNGSNGDFCIRCHTPIGMQAGEEPYMSNLDRNPVSLEGVSCIVCHRRAKPYGKTSGRMPINKGDIFETIYGPTGNEELKRVIESGDFDVNTERGKEGRHIHKEVFQFEQITTSAFCASCHDVNHVMGFRLEEAFSEYKSSPASERGISCQDCHMSKDPGLPVGFVQAPAAVVGGKPTRMRNHTNHMFVGPDYSVVHPGIFPHNPDAQRVANLREWLQFNFLDGWGTDDFEDNVEDDYEFPDRWADASDRYEAREIVDANLELLGEAAEERRKLLRYGYQLGDIVIKKAGAKGIDFKVEFVNATDGHNVPTGFDAERVVFLRVIITDGNGKEIFKSGDLDPNGDLRDAHSLYVHNGELPLDKQLFNLQSKFLVSMNKGGEREQVLSVNTSVSPLPYIRPSTRSTMILGRPAGARKHRMTIAPLESKWARYKVSKKELANSKPPYVANVKIIAGMVPVNLIHEIHDVGFDFGMSEREVADAVIAGHQVIWSKEFELKPGTIESISENSY